MPQSLAGKVAVVVGASSGMGRETVKQLAAAGANVMAAARRESRLSELKQEVLSSGGSIDVCVADVTQQQDVHELIANTHDTFGTVDLLVYATATNIPARDLKNLTPETWQMMLSTNLTGAFWCTREVLPVMRSSGGGLIIYISSAAVQMPDVSGVSYQASKHGLSGLAHGTRAEEKENGIRTSVIFPGLCDTEIIKQRPTPTPQEVLDKALQPTDVAEAVLFIASLDSRAVVPELQLIPSRI